MEEEQPIQRRRSKVEVYMHFVWTVKHRAQRLTPEYEREVYRCITAKAIEVGCLVLAIGGMPDHVHLLVRFTSKVGVSDFIRIIKTASTTVYNGLRPEYSEPFHWQDGYGAFSLWRTQLDKVSDYIHDQKARHAENRLWLELEEFDELVPEANSKRPLSAQRAVGGEAVV